MIEQQADQIAARIPGCARDDGADSTAHVLSAASSNLRLKKEAQSVHECRKRENAEYAERLSSLHALRLFPRIPRFLTNPALRAA
jgi:hypothetical protein